MSEPEPSAAHVALWPGAEDWLAELRDQRRVSPHTLSNYERDLRRLQTLAGNASPAELTALDLRRFVGRLHASGLSGRSIARSLSAWRGLLRWLARRGVLDANVAEGLHAPKHPKRLPDALSVDEAFRLLNPVATAETPNANAEREQVLQCRDQAMFELFYSSGIRLSELVGLDMDCLTDLRQGEVRVLGKELGLTPAFVGRHPFPGPGLAIRIPGEVTEERVAILQKADAIFLEELRKNNLYNEIWQAFAVLLPVKTVGVMGDARTYESVCALRAITSTDGMTADVYPIPHPLLLHIASRIVNEVRGINRVTYDITSKPPATIEWE